MVAFGTFLALLSLCLYHIGLMTFAYYPLALWFELRRWWWPRPSIYAGKTPLVSIIVPAYNEGKVIANCIESILACDYPRKEIILVNDGSRDNTLMMMRCYEHNPGVIVIAKSNGGKASALNAGLRRATGEVCMFVDADGIFSHDTIHQMLDAFDDPQVGAVCGNDSPSNLDRPQTHLLCLLSHVGTGFVRRALATINCLPIVSGNIGAFRREALERAGPFREGCIGEDLELTWRVHKAGFRVNFQPRAIVYAESPSTVGGLWRQRVRWARGLLQTIVLHRDIFFNPRYGLIAFFLPINVLSMVVLPVLQIVILIMLPLLALGGVHVIPTHWLALIGWLGLGTACATMVFALMLDRAWRELKYLYVLPLWVACSLFLNFVTIQALFLELRGAEARWNKLERTGVVTRR